MSFISLLQFLFRVTETDAFTCWKREFNEGAVELHVLQNDFSVAITIKLEGVWLSRKGAIACRCNQSGTKCLT